MFCSNCGAQIPDGSKFCGECGARIENEQMVNQQSVQPEPEIQPEPQTQPEPQIQPEPRPTESQSVPQPTQFQQQTGQSAPKKGMPGWAKVLIGIGIGIFALIIIFIVLIFVLASFAPDEKVTGSKAENTVTEAQTTPEPQKEEEKVEETVPEQNTDEATEDKKDQTEEDKDWTVKGEVKFKYYGYYLDDNIVRIEDDDMDKWYVTLKEDGSGYLYLGDDNQGDLGGWEGMGDDFVMKAGISVFEDGSFLKDGALGLDFDGNILVFLSDDANLEKLHPITLDEYKKMKE